MSKLDFYRRNLPHIHPENAVFFFTYNLEGAIPKRVIQGWKHELEELERTLKKYETNEQIIQNHLHNYRRHHFQRYEKYLDETKEGPRFLNRPEVAQTVVQSIRFLAAQGHWKPICWSIMPNHVHLIAHKIDYVMRCLQRHKAHTAREINKILGKERINRVWHSETFDHYFRNRMKCCQKVLYTLLNPEKAGLVRRWWDHPFTHLEPEYYHLIGAAYRPPTRMD